MVENVKDLYIKTVKIGVLLTYCAIILHNFLKMNMDIWKVDLDDTDNTNDTDEDDTYISRESDESLKRTGQAKRNFIFCQYFS